VSPLNQLSTVSLNRHSQALTAQETILKTQI